MEKTKHTQKRGIGHGLQQKYLAATREYVQRLNIDDNPGAVKVDPPRPLDASNVPDSWWRDLVAVSSRIYKNNVAQ